MRGLWLVVLAACRVPAVDLTGKACPCPAGYTCDLATNTCIRGDAGLPADAAADADDGPLPPRDSRESYRDVVLADHPLGYWRLGDVGPVAADETGTYDGTYSGTCTYGAAGAIAGDSNGAVTFDGSTCMITLPAAFPFTGTAPYTIEAWSSTTPNTLFQMIFCDETRSAQNPIDGYALLVTPATVSGGFELEREVATAAHKTPIAPAAPGYQYVVATYDGATLALYVNGVLFGSSADTRSAAAISQVALIGASSLGNAYQGTLDEIAIYPTALTATAIAAHYAAGTGN